MPADATAIKAAIFGDAERELAVTRTVLAKVPADKFAWKPHEKSMSLLRLATHVADLPEGGRAALDTDDLDFQKLSMPPASFASTNELVAFFDRRAEGLRNAIARFGVANWDRDLTMRDGERLILTRRRPLVYRVWCINHLISHRATLNLYLRLLNVPVATLYPNSADEPDWMFD